jgi:hypothetical protein
MIPKTKWVSAQSDTILSLYYETWASQFVKNSQFYSKLSCDWTIKQNKNTTTIIVIKPTNEIKQNLRKAASLKDKRQKRREKGSMNSYDKNKWQNSRFKLTYINNNNHKWSEYDN